MAVTGCLHAIIRPITSETRGAALAYGSAIRMKPMMKADINYTRNNQKQHGDNGIVEGDNGVNGGKVVFDPTDLTNEQKVATIGIKPKGSGYAMTGARSPFVSFGYLKNIERTTNGVTAKLWELYWIHKVQFSLNSDSVETKKEAKTYKNPTLEGEIYGVYLDGTGEEEYVYFNEHTSEAAAIAELDTLGGLSLSQVATPVADPVGGAVAAGSTVELSTTTPGAVIHYTTDGSTPTTGSQVYASALYIDRATTIKAIAVKSGMTNSAVMTEEYTIST